MKQFQIDSTAWVQITDQGRRGVCWLDFQDDWAAAVFGGRSK